MGLEKRLASRLLFAAIFASGRYRLVRGGPRLVGFLPTSMIFAIALPVIGVMLDLIVESPAV